MAPQPHCMGALAAEAHVRRHHEHHRTRMEDIAIVLQTYRTLAGKHAEIDYGDPRSVSRSNVAADRMRAIANDVARRTRSDVLEFATLIDESGSAAQLWAAHHVVELLPVPDNVVQRAIAVIENAAAGDTARAFGERIWLEEWHAKRSSPQHLRRNDA